MSEQTFGSFISQKRREKGISLRKFAESLGKFPSYICDIEKDRRHPVEREFLLKIAELLSLSDDEKNTLFDLSYSLLILFGICIISSLYNNLFNQLI